MLFICLCGVFNLLLDKPSANPLINTIAEYFLLKTVVSQRLTQKRCLKRPFFLLRQPIASRDPILSISLTVLQSRGSSEKAARLVR